MECQVFDKKGLVPSSPWQRHLRAFLERAGQCDNHHIEDAAPANTVNACAISGKFTTSGAGIHRACPCKAATMHISPRNSEFAAFKKVPAKQLPLSLYPCKF